MALTLKKISKLGAGRHFDRDGLYIDMAGTGNGSWLLRYQRDGRERWLGLGPLRDFDLEEARDRARKARQQLRDGVDPIVAKREQAAARKLEAARAVTFESAAKQYFDQHERKWSNARHRQQFLSSLTQHAFGKIGSLPVAMIDTAAVLSVLEPIWADKFVTAMRVRSRIAAVLDFATVRSWRAGDNPARWEGHLALLLPAKGEIAKVTHHKALAYSEMSAFVATLQQQQGVGARALEFLILTAARTSEVLEARWSEVNLAEKSWTVPAARMKSRKPHRVALSDRGVEILKSLPREGGDNGLVFIGPRAGVPLYKLEMARVLKRMNVDNATVHGMRATFRTWCAEQTSYPREVIEQCLAHVVGSDAEKSYQRSDLIEKRRQLMQQWAAFIATPARKTGDNITSIRKAGV